MAQYPSMHLSDYPRNPELSSRDFLRPVCRTAQHFTDVNLAIPRQLGLEGFLVWLDAIHLLVLCLPPSRCPRRTTTRDSFVLSLCSLRHLRCRRPSIAGGRAPRCYARRWGRAPTAGRPLGRPFASALLGSSLVAPPTLALTSWGLAEQGVCALDELAPYRCTLWFLIFINICLNKLHGATSDQLGKGEIINCSSHWDVAILFSPNIF